MATAGRIPSSLKKRFKFTSKGKVKSGVAYQRHGLLHQTNKSRKAKRKTRVLSSQESCKIKAIVRRR